jgi:hypothetical protein
MALIDGSMLDDIFGPSAPFSRDANERFLLDVDGSTLQIASGTLEVGVIGGTNIAPGAIDGTKLSILSEDVPHFSPNVAATDVKDALEEVALGYISRLPLAGGAMSGEIDMGSFKITRVGPAIGDQDALSLEAGRDLVRAGYFYRAPVGYAGVGNPNGALKTTWIRATASLYFTAQPSPGDTIDINGVTLEFQPGSGPNIIQIGGDVPTTVANAVSEINANTSITSDLIPLNTNVFAIRGSGDQTVLHLVVLNEDPPNTPEDGNDKTLVVTSVAIDPRGFEGGSGTLEDGTIAPDLFTNVNYSYDLMQPLAPWVSAGSIDAVDVQYTGAPIPNIIGSVPDNLENILISLDANLGAGVTPSAHAASHQNGGSDELLVTGLSGALADPQTPTVHASSHELAGSDQINVNGLSGKLAGLQDAGWIQTNPVSAVAPAPGEVLTWNGVTWAPAATGAATDRDTITGVTGPGLAVNDVVYVSASNTVAKADATAASTGPAIGVVVSAAAGIVSVRLFGAVTTFVGLTPGDEYFVSTTAGGITTTPPSLTGEYVQSLGIALTATTLLVKTGSLAVNT